MKLGNQNPNHCSFFFSGTKKGAKPFFVSYNINESIEELDKVMWDIRDNSVKITEPYNQIFYGITHKGSNAFLHCFRSIEDWERRPGFYTVSIVLPQKRAMAPGKAVELLNKLSALYYDLYIKPNLQHPNQILKEVTENQFAFIDIASSPQYQLIPADFDPSLTRIPLIAYKYQNYQELDTLFDNCHRDELLNAENALIFSVDQISMCPSSIQFQSSLPQEVVKYNFEIAPQEINGDFILNATFRVAKNGQNIASSFGADPKQIRGIKQSDIVQITIDAPGFQSKTISNSELFAQVHNQFSENIIVSVTLSKALQPIYKPEPNYGNQGGNRQRDERKVPPPNRLKLFVLLGVLAVTAIILTISFWPSSEVPPPPPPPKPPTVEPHVNPKDSGSNVGQQSPENNNTPNQDSIGAINSYIQLVSDADEAINNKSADKKADLIAKIDLLIPQLKKYGVNEGVIKLKSQRSKLNSIKKTKNVVSVETEKEKKEKEKKEKEKKEKEKKEKEKKEKEKKAAPPKTIVGRDNP